jgi:hypothetical protein
MVILFWMIVLDLNSVNIEGLLEDERFNKVVAIPVRSLRVWVPYNVCSFIYMLFLSLLLCLLAWNELFAAEKLSLREPKL